MRGLAGELASPIGIFASGVEVDEGAIKSDSPLKEAFVAEVSGDGMGLAGAAFEDEIEGTVLGVPGLRSAAAGSIVGGIAVGGGDELEGEAETFPDFVRYKESGRHGGPEFDGRKGVADATGGREVRIDNLLGLDMAELELRQKVGVGRVVSWKRIEKGLRLKWFGLGE